MNWYESAVMPSYAGRRRRHNKLSAFSSRWEIAKTGYIHIECSPMYLKE